MRATLASATVEDLTYRYKTRNGAVTAVDRLSFSVTPGKVCGLVGPNGAGKTTTMRAVLGLLRPWAGVVRWDGREIGYPERQHFAYLPAQRGLYGRMRVAAQLRFMGRIHGMAPAEAKAATARWLERLGVAGFARRQLVVEGEQQRVQLASCFLYRPRLIVLDEPFTWLDLEGVALLAELLGGAGSRGRGDPGLEPPARRVGGRLRQRRGPEPGAPGGRRGGRRAQGGGRPSSDRRGRAAPGSVRDGATGHGGTCGSRALLRPGRRPAAARVDRRVRVEPRGLAVVLPAVLLGHAIDAVVALDRGAAQDAHPVLVQLLVGACDRRRASVDVRAHEGHH